MAARVLLIDNYDSFTYNLVQELGELGAEPVVYRNDAIDVAGIRAEAPDAVIISPGPGRPENSGVSLDVVTELGGEFRVLGVCLGLQCIGQAFGGRVVAAPVLMHGKTSAIFHTGVGVFAEMPNPFEATRYHSLVIRKETWNNPEFIVSAWTEEGEIMGVRHKTWPLHGVQFHPESFLTLEGPRLLKNFVAK